MGRALAPIEQTIAQWPAIQQASGAWSRVKLALTRPRPTDRGLSLPTPVGRVKVANLAIVAPGDNQVLLAGVDFEVGPGDVVGVIGPSGSGKFRPGAGRWRASGRRPGARSCSTARGWTSTRRTSWGQYLGYVPQDIDLLPGTIAPR